MSNMRMYGICKIGLHYLYKAGKDSFCTSFDNRIKTPDVKKYIGFFFVVKNNCDFFFKH